MKKRIRSAKQFFSVNWKCRYDGYPCDKALCCQGCDRMKLNDLPNANAPTGTVIWVDSYGGKEPQCPECHEYAYGMSDPDENGIGQCPFCGQHYQFDEEGRERAKPNPEETILCVSCGQMTMVGRRAKSNGHFHGRCTNCGATMIQ